MGARCRLRLVPRCRPTPIERRKEGVQVMGIARLRYRPRTSLTLAFVAREADWQAALDRLLEIAATRELATSRGHQG